MRHKTHVTQHASCLHAAGVLKAAEDLASLLDDPLFSLQGDTQSDAVHAIMDSHEAIFHDLCALCVRAGAPAMAVDRKLFELRLQTDVDEKIVRDAQAIHRQVVQRLRGQRSRGAQKCRMLASVIVAFPQAIARFPGDVRGKQLMDALNLHLLALGVDPITPDYATRTVATRMDERGPSAEASVVIVDDDRSEILTTARTLVGWPNLVTTFFHYERGDQSGHSAEKERKVAQDLLALIPSIVLLDQGMGDVEGDGVLRCLQELAVTPPLVVANSGGGGEELRRLGALMNCNKGRNHAGIRQAIAHLG